MGCAFESRCAFETVLLVISAIALPIYILILATLIKYRKTPSFKTAFFTLFISLGVADICSMVNGCLIVKALGFSWFRGIFLSYPNQIATHTSIWTFQSYLAQMNGVLLLSLNRYTALVMPAKHKQYWCRENLWKLIAGQWILSIICSIPRAFIPISYLSSPDNQSLTFDYSQSLERGSTYFKFCTAYSFVLGIITVFLYARMALHVYKSERQVAHAAQNDNRRNDKRLAAIGGVVAFSLFLFSIFTSFMLTSLDFSVYARLWAFTADFFNECNPFLILIFCTDMRVYIKKMLGIKATVASAGNTKSGGKGRKRGARQQQRGQQQGIEIL